MIPLLKNDTYPGGRFLDTGAVVDGKVVLDFNRAYNPPCAVTPYATCPLSPERESPDGRDTSGREVRQGGARSSLSPGSRTTALLGLALLQ